MYVKFFLSSCPTRFSSKKKNSIINWVRVLYDITRFDFTIRSHVARHAYILKKAIFDCFTAAAACFTFLIRIINTDTRTIVSLTHFSLFFSLSHLDQNISFSIIRTYVCIIYIHKPAGLMTLAAKRPF